MVVFCALLHFKLKYCKIYRLTYLSISAPIFMSRVLFLSLLFLFFFFFKNSEVSSFA